MSDRKISPLKYEHDVIRTALVGATYTEDMNLVAEALAGETAELVEEIMLGAHQRANIVLEAGDILYYIVMGGVRILATHFTTIIKLADAYPCDPSDSFRLVKLMVEAGKLCDTVKKIAYHKHPQDKATLTAHLVKLFSLLAAVIAAEGITWQEVLIANMEKRALRYPVTFSTLRSLNRLDVSHS